jgi:hypothetical protein
VRGKEYDRLLKEADELTAIFTASYATAKSNQKQKKIKKRQQAARKSPTP